MHIRPAKRFRNTGVSRYLLALCTLMVALVVLVPVTASGDSGEPSSSADDATLILLELTGVDFGTFDSEVSNYWTPVANSVSQTTLVAAASDSQASANISHPDADTEAAGYQINLNEGINIITLTVVSSSGRATKTYSITINRASTAIFGWNSLKDINILWEPGERWGYATGLWSDGDILWVADSLHERINAYNFATGERKRSRDITELASVGNGLAADLWSDGTTMWVLEGDLDGVPAHLMGYTDGMIFAYDLATGERDGERFIDTLHGRGNTEPVGMWSDGATVWVVDSNDDYIYAYELETGRRAWGRDIRAPQMVYNNHPRGMWSDGSTLWVIDYWDNIIYAYDLATGHRQPGLEFHTLWDAGNRDPRGLWSDGTTMWVTDAAKAKIFAYNMPHAANLQSLELEGIDFEFSRTQSDYSAPVPSTKATTTVTATPASPDADVLIQPEDADADTEGHQVNLSQGENTVAITVTTADASISRVYTVTVDQRDSPEISDVATLSSLAFSGIDLGAFNSETTEYIAGVSSDTATTTLTSATTDKYATKAIEPADADPASEGHQINLAEGANKVTITVESSDGTNEIVYNVALNRASTALFGWNPLQDFNAIPGAPNAILRGLWSDGSTIWVADSENLFFRALNLQTGAHQPTKDIDLEIEGFYHSPEGLWSDGATLWAVDRWGNRIYAFNLASGERDSEKNFRGMIAAGNVSPTGVWSDGTTMWVADRRYDKLFAYTLASGERDSDKDIGGLSRAGNDEPKGLWSDGTTIWVADQDDGKIYAYDLATGVRQADKEFNTLSAAGNDQPYGIWSDGTTMWVADLWNQKIFAYNMSVPVAAEFAEATYSVSEGSSVVVTVELDQAPERELVLPLSATGEDGASTPDYSGIPESVTFAASDTSQTFTFTAADDSEDDDGETVRIEFGTLPAGASAGTVGETVVSIVDDDAPAVVAEFAEATYSVSEGSSVVVTVELDQAPERELVLPLSATGEDGASTLDYSGIPESVTFAASDTSQTFTFTAADDSEDDDGETVRIEFGTLPAGASAGTAAETVVSIIDDDAPAVVAEFAEATYSVSEGSSVVVTVELDQAPERELVLPLTATGEDGASTPDYSGIPESVTFAASDTSQTFTFTATDDSEDDDGETVRIEFGTLPAGASAGTADETVVSIVDDDAPAVVAEFAEATYSVSEGSSVVVTVELDQAPERELVLPLSATGEDGASTLDYSGIPESVTFAALDTSQTFTFTATGDSEDDDGETVRIEFGTLPAGASAGTVDETVVSIVDDEQSGAVGRDESEEAEEEEQEPLTGEFENVPDSFNGNFKLRLRFSDPLADGFSYRSLRDHALQASDGTIKRSKRVNRRNDLWEITVQPGQGASTITITINAGTDCNAPHAICASGDRLLSNNPEATVTRAN